MKTGLPAWILWITFLVSAVVEWGFDFDCPLTPAAWLLAVAITLFATDISAALTTNRWAVTSNGGSKWEFASSWDHGVPSPNYSVHVLAPATTLDTVATLDVATVVSNLGNGCLTVSNLVVKGGGGFMPPTATLSLSNMSDTPGTIGLAVQNSLTISSHGMVSITNSYLYVGLGGAPSSGLFDDGFLLLNTGTLLTGAGTFTVGNTGAGRMTVSNGKWLAGVVAVGNAAGSMGTLTLEGGTTVVTQQLYIANQRGSTGSVWMTGGQLVTTNFSFGAFVIGGAGNWQMIVSNGTWLGASVFFDSLLDVPSQQHGVGKVTLAGGNYSFSDALGGSGASTAIWMTGGQLDAYLFLGCSMTVSNGVVHAPGVDIEDGTLTLAGGQMIVTNSPLNIGASSGEFGNLNLLGGSFLANEADLGLGLVTAGYLTMRGGTATIWRVNLGQFTSEFPNTGAGQGELLMAGGSMTVSNLMVGDCFDGGGGIVRMIGGALYVTNATHDAILDVQSGSFLLEGGTLVVDILRVNVDFCAGLFDHTGGTLSYRTLALGPFGDADGDGLPDEWEQLHGFDPLSSSGDNGPEGDPDGDGYSNLDEYFAGSDPRDPLSTPLQIVPPPFQITSLLRSNNDIVLTWTTAGGTTNQVQVSPGSGGDNYSTNGFINLGSPISIPGNGIVTTNFTDNGGATNTPSRYYRVRLVP